MHFMRPLNVPESHIWALGLIAFYLLTAQNYWNATRSEETSLTALFGEILSLPLTSPSEVLQSLGRPALPLGFDEWFFRCVNRDVAQRFSTAGAAVAELAGLFRIVLAEGPGRAAQASRRAGGSPLEVSGAASSALGARTDNAVTLSRSAAPKRAMLPLLAAGAVLVVGAAFAWLHSTTDTRVASPTTVAEAVSAAPQPLAGSAPSPSNAPAPAVTSPSAMNSAAVPVANPIHAQKLGAARGKKLAPLSTAKTDEVFGER